MHSDCDMDQARGIFTQSLSNGCEAGFPVSTVTSVDKSQLVFGISS